MSSAIHFKNDKLVMGSSTMGTHHELNSKNFILGIFKVVVVAMQQRPK
jgi:hypothetical protein